MISRQLVITEVIRPLVYLRFFASLVEISVAYKTGLLLLATLDLNSMIHLADPNSFYYQ